MRRIKPVAPHVVNRSESVTELFNEKPGRDLQWSRIETGAGGLGFGHGIGGRGLGFPVEMKTSDWKFNAGSWQSSVLDAVELITDR